MPVPDGFPVDDASDASESPDAFPLTIEKLIYGGDALARDVNGEVLFIPWAVPGDHILASRTASTQKPARAHLERIVQPSPDRVSPRCDVFSLCGGCQWQHISGLAQRDWKRRIVEESLSRIGGFRLDDGSVTVNPTWGDDAPSWRYRNRVQWDLSVENARVALGYSRAQSHQLVTFTDCHLIPDSMNVLHSRLRQFFQDILSHGDRAPVSSIHRVEVFQNPQGEALLSLYGNWHPNLSGMAASLMDEIDLLTGVAHFDNRRKNVRRLLYGEGSLLYRLAGRSYRVSAGSFFQTNERAAEYLVQQACNWLPPNTEKLADLYAGVGTFAIALHDKARQVMAVETAGSSVEDARKNIRLNQAENIMLHAGNVDKVLNTLKMRFEAAIVDPPRSGCSAQVLRWLTEQVTERLLYISCNPTTLARDLKSLTSQGWRINSVQPVDMFPQTYHVETIVSLSRK